MKNHIFSIIPFLATVFATPLQLHPRFDAYQYLKDGSVAHANALNAHGDCTSFLYLADINKQDESCWAALTYCRKLNAYQEAYFTVNVQNGQSWSTEGFHGKLTTGADVVTDVWNDLSYGHGWVCRSGQNAFGTMAISTYIVNTSGTQT